MPCSEKRARLLLERKQAVVHKIAPFTIRLKERVGGEVQPVRLKLDPGSKTTGIALVREEETVSPESGETEKTAHVLFLGEIEHRGGRIRDRLTARRAFRRRRRSKLRYREPRFDNRTRPEGWLPPSLQHRVDTTMAWVNRIRRLAPVVAISQELVRFDLQKMENPEIEGREYQQGTLFGTEIRGVSPRKVGANLRLLRDGERPSGDRSHPSPVEGRIGPDFQPDAGLPPLQRAEGESPRRGISGEETGSSE